MNHPGVQHFTRNPDYAPVPDHHFTADAMQYEPHDPTAIRNAVEWLTALGEDFDFIPDDPQPALIDRMGRRLPPGSWIVSPSWHGGVTFLFDDEFRAIFVPAEIETAS